MRDARDAPEGAAIVKLGGSLAYNPHLRDWLAACRSSRFRTVVVPGGGPFADAVRYVQVRMGLDDRTAHRMALLAMAQFAEALSSLESGFILASDHDALMEALAGPLTPIWSPLDLLAGAPGIEESWDVTSDSLAAWLAGDLGIRTLVLVKQAALPLKALSLREMVAEGVVDAAFPSFIENSGVRVIWLGPADSRELDKLLADGAAANSKALTIASTENT